MFPTTYIACFVLSLVVRPKKRLKRNGEQKAMERQLFTVMLQQVVIMVTERIVSALFRKAGQPGVCGEMAAGLILGPSIFGNFSDVRVEVH